MKQTELKRRTPLKKKRDTPRRVGPKVKRERILRGPKRVWPAHDDYIRSLPCTFCGAPPRSVQMHISTAANSGKAIRAPSWCSIPSCDHDHRDAHQRGHITKAREHGFGGLAGLLAIAAFHAQNSPDIAMKGAMKEGAS